MGVVESEIVPFLQARAAAGEKADLIFMDLDKTCYLPCYEAIMAGGLLAPGGILVSDKTSANAVALKNFVDRVGQDKDAGRVRTLMMPVRDGILAIATPCV